jgi:hypothetical protein
MIETQDVVRMKDTASEHASVGPAVISSLWFIKTLEWCSVIGQCHILDSYVCFNAIVQYETLSNKRTPLYTYLYNIRLFADHVFFKNILCLSWIIDNQIAEYL